MVRAKECLDYHPQLSLPHQGLTTIIKLWSGSLLSILKCHREILSINGWKGLVSGCSILLSSQPGVPGN